VPQPPGTDALVDRTLIAAIDLRARLERHGFLLEPAFGMAVDLQAGSPPRVPHQSAIEIEPAEDAATMETWTRVLCESFGASPRFGDAFVDLAAAIGLDASSPFRHFLASVDGQPVATCSLFLGAGVAGIYDVATLAQHRRRGVGSFVTRAAMNEARSLGYRMVILHSSTSGVGIYRSLGFREVCSIGQHVWTPPGFSR
jgi:ribosomal protein S18 acetylase RimI-like enzyme